MDVKTIASNRKAYHDFFVLDRLEAGIMLTGTEIKSVRGSRVSLADSYVRPENGALWLFNAHIARYDAGSYNSHEPTRPRKLLLHRKEIRLFTDKAAEKGLTLVPLSLYLKGGLAKVEIALAKGKKLYDKRETLMRNEAEREMGRAVKKSLMGSRA